MSIPIIISTWSFSESIINAAFPSLSKPMSALDVVEQCAMAAERDESIDSVGFGGYPDREGRCTFDAAIMTSPSQSGAVAGIERHRHPISIARLVMENTKHKMLVGSLADDFADSHGLQSSTILSDRAKAKWEKWKKSKQKASPPAPFDHGDGEIFGSHDTIGTLAIDASGMMAGACSTSGMAYKVPGRVGDSPIIGHGLYVDPQRGAATATGHGELISGVCGAFLVVELMGQGATPVEAIHETLSRIANSYDLHKEHQTAFLALTPAGHFAGGALRSGFKYAYCSSEDTSEESSEVSSEEEGVEIGVLDPDVVLHEAAT